MKLENMSEFNFKSQICTDKVQSERLLALGLKKETADMKYPGTREYYGGVLTEGVSSLPIIIDTEDDEVTEWDIPAWSLHRLIEILDTNPCVFYTNCGYDNIIDRIEEYIKEGIMDARYMNEGYLEEE